MSSKLHFMPRTGFYEYIHIANPKGLTAPDTSGLISYVNGKGSADASHATLAVSVPVNSSYVFKPLVHTIIGGNNVSVNTDGGYVTISADVSGGTNPSTNNSSVTYFLGTIDSSAKLDASGACYIYTQAAFADFTNRYVEVHMYNGAGKLVTPDNGFEFWNGGQAIKVGFGSKSEFVRVSENTEKMYVHIAVADAYVANVSTGHPAVVADLGEAAQVENGEKGNLSPVDRSKSGILDSETAG